MDTKLNSKNLIDLRILFAALLISLFNFLIIYGLNYWLYFRVAQIYSNAAHNLIIMSDKKGIDDLFKQAGRIFSFVEIDFLPRKELFKYGNRNNFDLSVKFVNGSSDDPFIKFRFFYSSFYIIAGFIASLIGTTILSFYIRGYLLKRLDEKIRKLELEAKSSAIVEISKQVAHDIRSPLTALLVVKNKNEILNDGHSQLLTSAIYRIKEIADDLLKLDEERPEVNYLYGRNQIENNWVNTLIGEKLLEYGDFNLTIRPPSLNIEIDNVRRADLKRILSNLINNSVEAGASNIEIQFSLLGSGNLGCIKVIDNGQGIPQDTINKIISGKFTSKISGNGIGLSFLKKWVKKYNGDLSILSKYRSGTEIIFTFTIDC